MEIQIQKDFSLSDKLTAISTLLNFITQKMQLEENKLIKENLFYEMFLNKQLKAKKPLSHNYMKTNQERKQAQQPEKMSINQMPEEVFENHIQENILNVIQKAQLALQEINEDPKPKFQKPEISPYEQGIKKPAIKKPPIQANFAANKVPQKQEELPPKKNFSKVVLHKQSSMQTTYNSSFSNKNSNRSSSKSRTDPTAPTQSSAARQNSLNQKNTTSFGSPLYNPLQNKQQTSVIQSQNPNKVAQSPNNTQQSQQNTPQIVQNSSSNLKQQQQQKIQQSQQIKESSQLDNKNTSTSTSASTKTQINQQNIIESKIQTEQSLQQKSQLNTLEIFKDGSDLFENMDKNDLQIFYNSKKNLLKSQKEYQQQSKYYKEKEIKARGKFLSKLTSHIRERHLVTNGKLIQYENSKKQDEINKQRANQRKGKVDKYTDDQQEEENKQEFDPFYEYTFIDDNSQDEQSKYFSQIKQINKTMVGLQQYGQIILQNINLNSESEEIVFLKQIKQNINHLEETNDLHLMFKMWYFIINLEKNYGIFKKINSDTIIQFTQCQKLFRDNYFKTFLSYQNQQVNQNYLNENENQIKMIQFQFQDKDIIRYLESSVLNKSDHFLIHEINKQSIKNILFQIIEKYVIQYLEETMMNNINSSKINLKLLQQHLKLIRGISGIVEYSGKLLPSFFLTDSIQKYFENIQD